ncbi:MAG TPA: ABC transporter substrate-binding protein [Longimicrobiales bacterium]
MKRTAPDPATRCMRRRTGRHILLAAALIGLGACAADPQPIYLGIAGPVSQPTGRSLRLAAEMAVAEINEAGGIDGRRLALVIKDDEARPDRAIEVATELRNDPRILAVIGHINSAATLAAAEIYNAEENGVVEISPASSSPRVTDAGPWTFRVCPSDLQHGPVLAEWTYDRLERRKAAILYANDDYGRGLLGSFGDAFEQAGGVLVARDPFLPALMEADDALDPYLERAIQRGMDALVIAGQAEEGLDILRAARRLGYDGPVLGADGITGMKDAGPIANGVFITSAFLPDRPTPEAQAFVEAYVERYDELPDHRGAMAYDAIYLLVRALREVNAVRKQHAEPTLNGARTVRREIRDYLATVGRTTPPFEGVSGTIVFDENGDVAGKDVAVGIIRDGRIVTAS